MALETEVNMLQPQGPSATTQNWKRESSALQTAGLKQAPLTVDFSHQNCKRMNFDFCESFVTSAASRKPYWDQTVGLVKRSHSERHRRGKAEDLPGSTVYEAGRKATEVERRTWTMRNEGLVGTL